MIAVFSWFRKKYLHSVEKTDDLSNSKIISIFTYTFLCLTANFCFPIKVVYLTVIFS